MSGKGASSPGIPGSGAQLFVEAFQLLVIAVMDVTRFHLGDE